MRQAISEDDVMELGAGGGHRAAAEHLLALADDPHPDDEVSVRELLSLAGEQFELAKDEDGALALYRRSLAAEGESMVDPRSFLISLLLRRGEEDEALVLDGELRRSGQAAAVDHTLVGEAWEEHGDARRALGWYTRGILRHEQGPGFEESDLTLLCLSRLRLRESLGHEPDDYDLIGIGARRQWQADG